MLDFISENRKPIITLALVTVVAYVFYFLDEIKTTSVLVFGWGYAVPLVLIRSSFSFSSHGGNHW